MVRPTGHDPNREGTETRFTAVLRAADRATTVVERPVRGFAGVRDLNPLPHAGTISVFLLAVVIVSGLYITLFFSFGHAASYDAVAAMEGHAIQRVVRALHRYASAALVLTTLVHAWRILTSQRFTSGRRRWRWASGVASLGLVWLAGVSGHWLVWDRRAAAISEATAQLLGVFEAGQGFAIDHLLGISPGSGSGMLLSLWFVHLGLSVAIGWFMFRHLRRSKQPWLPPVQLMSLMGVALLVVSVALPLGMLGPARPDQLVADMPLDPFVLFLLPPLLSSFRWFALVAAVLVFLVAVGLPWLLRRSDPPPIVIDEQACTGCDLCVQDCPYDALSLRARAKDSDRFVAVLEAKQCVACGICVGSCAFDALALPGWTFPSSDVEGRKVTVACDRHDLPVDVGDSVTIPVRCAGMFTAGTVRGYFDRGATSVELVGCPPADCRFGTGNTLAAERIAGERSPHPPRRYASRVSMATSGDGNDPVRQRPESNRDAPEAQAQLSRLVRPGMLVLLSVVVIVAATRAPFRTDANRAEIRVVVDHLAGAEVAEIGEPAGAVAQLELTIDGRVRRSLDVSSDDDRAIGFGDWVTEPGKHDLMVALVAGADERTVLFDAAVELDPRERLVLTATDVPPPPGADQGRDVFTSRAAGCSTCHSTEAGDELVGPSLHGIADTAGERVEGLTAAHYLRQSILLPDQYVVDGWRAGQMLPIYRERLTEEDLEALLVYLGTLTVEEPS